jgi:ABC-type oligopeptide transport system substrate-binding subunit
MKFFFRYLMTIMLAFSLAACSASSTPLLSTETPTEEGLALQTLDSFFDSLHNGKYAEAALLYGGSYEGLIEWNPMIEPNDFSALLDNACTINGLQCLQMKSAILDKKVSDTEFVFKVEFSNADGTTFTRGPCCGGNETDSPSVSMFYFTVKNNDNNNYSVMELPPYVP